jgi:ATP-binding cassette subfamily B protein
MPLLETLPDDVARTLQTLAPTATNGHIAAGNGHAAPDSEALEPKKEYKPITFATDVDMRGEWGEEWLVVDGTAITVLERGKNGPKVRLTVPMSTVKEAKADVQVGSGFLEVRTDTYTHHLLRFSHANSGEAHVVARYINAIAKSEEAPEEKPETKKKKCDRCGRALPDDTEVCPACVNKRAVMLRLFRFLAPYKMLSVASVVVILVSTAADIAPPWLGGRLVDVINNEVKSHHRDMLPIYELVGLLVLARLLQSALMYIQRRLNPWIGGRVLMDIRLALFHKFSELSLGYYDKRSIGSVMSRITNDSDNLWDFLTDGVPWLLSTLLTLVLTTAVLLKMNWQLTLLLLLPAPLIYSLNKWFMPRARGKWRHVWHRISKMYSSLNSTLNGMRVVKAFAQEDRENETFYGRNRQVFEASYAANAMWATYWPLLAILISLGSWIVWMVGGLKVMQGAMTIGVLTAFIGYLGQFYMPFQNLSRVMDWATRSLTAAERVFEVLDTSPEIREAGDAVAMPEITGAIDFKAVAFTYDKGKRVLDNFSLSVEPGEMIGLVGHSGAGKSTLINLLSRFYDVTEGSISVDGVDIRNIKQSDFRRQFGIVLQEPFLFPGTIRDNIAYAKPDASTEDILRAAKAANCHEFILKFPDGYDTQVGDRGQRLSGGERQRISIARAILHNPRILILDEATASVDTETEKQIQDAIARLVQNRTTFAIAHRLSTLRNASRLVVMKDGKMVECGTHDELMDLDGEYAKLVKIQVEVNKLRAL